MRCVRGRARRFELRAPAPPTRPARDPSHGGGWRNRVSQTERAKAGPWPDIARRAPAWTLAGGARPLSASPPPRTRGVGALSGHLRATPPSIRWTPAADGGSAHASPRGATGAVARGAACPRRPRRAPTLRSQRIGSCHRTGRTPVPSRRSLDTRRDPHTGRTTADVVGASRQRRVAHMDEGMARGWPPPRAACPEMFTARRERKGPCPTDETSSALADYPASWPTMSDARPYGTSTAWVGAPTRPVSRRA